MAVMFLLENDGFPYLAHCAACHRLWRRSRRTKSCHPPQSKNRVSAAFYGRSKRPISPMCLRSRNMSMFPPVSPNLALSNSAAREQNLPSRCFRTMSWSGLLSSIARRCGRYGQTIELVTNFAAQAVIAIENTRLLNELRTRTNELAQSVGELQALGEVSQAVNSTLDLETVLTTIVGRAVQLSRYRCRRHLRVRRGAQGVSPRMPPTA